MGEHMGQINKTRSKGRTISWRYRKMSADKLKLNTWEIYHFLLCILGSEAGNTFTFSFLLSFFYCIFFLHALTKTLYNYLKIFAMFFLNFIILYVNISYYSLWKGKQFLKEDIQVLKLTTAKKHDRVEVQDVNYTEEENVE